MRQINNIYPTAERLLGLHEPDVPYIVDKNKFYVSFPEYTDIFLRTIFALHQWNMCFYDPIYGEAENLPWTILPYTPSRSDLLKLVTRGHFLSATSP